MRTCPLHSRQLCLQSAARKQPGDHYGQRDAEHGFVYKRSIGNYNKKLIAKLKNKLQQEIRSKFKTQMRQQSAILKGALVHLFASAMKYLSTSATSPLLAAAITSLLPAMRAAAVACSRPSSLMTAPLITRATMRFIQIISVSASMYTLALPQARHTLAGAVTSP